MNILSIQSHVAYGHVGNSAAVFPLQRLGHDVWPIHTVAFSNHLGYPTWSGRARAPEEAGEIVDGLDRLGALKRCDAVLSGYLGDRGNGAVVLDAVARVRAANPNALYACDPVMGDRGVGLFVKPDIPAIFSEQLLPAADMTFPNAFELEQLTGGGTDRLSTALAAADALRARMRPGALVVVTSLLRSDGPTGRIEVLAVSADVAWLIELAASRRAAARGRRLLRGAVPRPLPQVAQHRRHPRPRRLGDTRRARGVGRRRRTADHRGAGPTRSAGASLPPAPRSLTLGALALGRGPGVREVALHQALGDLHGVEGRTLAQVVGDDPERQPVRDRRILADPADVDGVLAGAFDRRDVALILAIIDERDARRLAQCGPRLARP